VQPDDSPSAVFVESVRGSLIALAEIGANRLLGFDEAALAGCRELRGHCIAIEVTDLDFRLYCHPGDWGIRLSPNPPPRDPDATISGRLVALANLASEDDKLATSMQERVRFHGDVKLAQKLQRILGGLDIDWEEALSKYTGDVVAFQVHQRARRLGDWLKLSAESLLQTTSDYLREEVRVSPTEVEFEQQQAAITALKHDVSRAEARLARLLERRR
jgi:ubiquinone biosynthesis protein UbiJ